MAVRHWIRQIPFYMACAGANWGCASDPRRPAPLAEQDIQAAADAPDDDDNPTLALQLDDDWPDLVEKDITDLEKKTELFTERASALYDLLLNHGDGAQIAPATIDTALNEALAAYRELSKSAETLAHHLKRSDVRKSLDQEGSFTEQYERVEALVATYRSIPALSARYDFQDQKPLTAMFHVNLEGDLPSSAIPKPQRDALVLLDWLQQLSHEMAFVSTAVTGWVAERRQHQPAHNLSMDTLAH